MEKIISGNIVIELIDYHHLNYLKIIRQIKKFRYHNILTKFNSLSINDNEEDDDGYDNLARHLVAWDIKANEIVGYYRITTKDTLDNNDFICEKEFNIFNIKNKGLKIIEVSRAVVHPNYRNGVVVKLLWQGLLKYSIEMEAKYLIGTASFMGVDDNVYLHSLSFLYYNYQSVESLSSWAKNPSISINKIPQNELNLILVKKQLPPLIKGYLRLGATVSKDAYLDYQFNSIDVLILLDLQKVNKRYFKLLKGE